MDDTRTINPKTLAFIHHLSTHIIIVDVNANAVRESLAQILLNLGYDIKQDENVEPTEDHAHCNLLLVDEVKRIQRASLSPDTLVLAVLSQQDSLEDYQECDVDDVFWLPLNQEQVRMRLRLILRMHAQSTRNQRQGEVFGNIHHEGTPATDQHQSPPQAKEIKSMWFAASTIDALSAHIAVLDIKGDILAVNKAWRDFPQINTRTSPNPGVGTNYLTYLETTNGDKASYNWDIALGLRQVVQGEIISFSLPYPRSTPEESMWFNCRVTSFPDNEFIVIAHENITEQIKARNQTRETARRLQSMANLFAEVSKSSDLESAFRRVAEQAIDLFRVHAVFIEYQLNPREKLQILIGEDKSKRATIKPETIFNLDIEKKRRPNHPSIFWNYQLDKAVITASLRSDTPGQFGRFALLGGSIDDFEEDKIIFRQFIHLTTTLAHNLTLIQAVQRRASHLSVINGLGRYFAEVLDIEAMFYAVKDALLELFPGISAIVISQFEAAEALLHPAFIYHGGIQEDVSKIPPIPLEPPGVGTQSEVVHTRRPLTLNDYQAYLQKQNVPEKVRQGNPIKSAIYMPLLAKENVMGVLNLQHVEKNAFSEQDIELLRWVGNTMAIAMANTKLFQQIRLRVDEIQRLDHAINQSIDGIIIADLDGIIEFANPAWANMHGYEPGTLQGKNLRIFEANGNEQQTYAAFFDQAKREGAAESEFYQMHQDGHVFPAVLTATLLRNTANEPTGFVCLGRDVTAQKQAETRLKNALTKLEQTNKELKQFNNVASHDLQEPLRMIASFLQLLDRRYCAQLDDTGREYISNAITGAVRMKTIINDFLTFSRLETPVNKRQHTDLNQVVESVRRTRALSIQDNQVQFPRGELPVIIADEAQIFQLFHHLLGNAVKFRKPGAPLHIEITAEKTETHWAIAIRDHGIGFEPEYADRIFDIFRQLHSSNEYEGTGIGLAICKRIVEHHGGRIWAEAVPGQGATFFFTLSLK